MPFINMEIDRSLSLDFIQLILTSLVSSGKAQWEKDKESCLIYWHTPDEWAILIYKWVFDTGKNGSVCTLYEIINGEECIEQGIRDLCRFL
jgi:ESCRT-II complex subunit VPS25